MDVPLIPEVTPHTHSDLDLTSDPSTEICRTKKFQDSHPRNEVRNFTLVSTETGTKIETRSLSDYPCRCHRKKKKIIEKEKFLSL